jgi:hypothetical protein
MADMSPRILMRTIYLAASSSILVAACGPTGSGNVVTETREVAEFDSIEVSGGITLRLTAAVDADPSVTVTYDDNLIDRVGTDVHGTTLVIESRGGFTVLGEGRLVEVTTPSLDELEASGGTEVTGSGSLGSLSLAASGGTEVDLADLIVDSMNLEASGGASVVVNVTERIEGAASGGAEVTILGNPASQIMDVSGGADVGNG